MSVYHPISHIALGKTMEKIHTHTIDKKAHAHTLEQVKKKLQKALKN